MTDLDHLEAELQDLRGRLFSLRSHLDSKLIGQREVLDQMLIALLADGHVLLEGAPGLGKTTLVRAMAQGLDLSFG
ncbi:MAG TPA: AAA family ATPase, partial [Planctomycetes bacterium]|nr:AAA family ATPase [Planctomycetota bacterium]